MDDPFSNRYAKLYFDPKDPNNLKTFQTRQLFLRAAAESVPDFAVSLFKEGGGVIAAWVKNNGALPRPASPSYAVYYSQIFATLRAWARNFNIEVDWVVDEAYSTITLGIIYSSKGIDPLTAFGAWRRETHPGSRTRTFELPAWNPLEERDTQYLARADKAWVKLRDEYVEATKRELAEAGLAKIPARRKRRLDKKLYFEWAALRLCACMPIEELAEQYREDTEVIRVSVARILRDLGFDPPT